ncbi:hypothetical protein J2S97_003857 [Arthrobacter oryzae]|nr:hypothetical protein [Arthrobacter oryzae]
MRYQGLVACQPRPFRITTEADAKAAAGPGCAFDYTLNEIAPSTSENRGLAPALRLARNYWAAMVMAR